MKPAPDKLQHVGVGFVGYTVSYEVTRGGEVSFAVVLMLGGGKEVYDRLSGKGHPEVADFLWTSVGGLIGFLISSSSSP